VFKNKVLRKTFSLKKAEVAGGWRKVHNEEIIIRILHQIIRSRRMKCAGHVAQMGEIRNRYRISVE
jgi:hypothetical protein